MSVDKVASFANAIERWRDHYKAMSAAVRHRPKLRDERKSHAESLDRRKVALACLAASLLLHDRAVYTHRQRIEKVKADFEKNGMFMPGFRYQWIGDRPIAIPLDNPLVVKNPFAAANVKGI